MKRIVSLCLVLFVAALVAACSQGAPSNPVAPDTTSLTAATFEPASTGPWPHEDRLVCHHNPNYLTDGGYEWTVIDVNYGGQFNGHCAFHHNGNHGDYTPGGYLSCAPCAIQSYEPGDDCGFCAAS